MKWTKEPVETSTQSSIKVNTIFCINVEFISRHLLVILRDNKGSPLGIPENHFPSNNNLKEKKTYFVETSKKWGIKNNHFSIKLVMPKSQ